MTEKHHTYKRNTIRYLKYYSHFIFNEKSNELIIADYYFCLRDKKEGSKLILKHFQETQENDKLLIIQVI